MASPKSGKDGSLVAPAAPAAAVEAMNEKPGEVSKAELKGVAPVSVKTEKVSPPVFKPPEASAAAEETKLTWIEIALVDLNGDPITGAAYEIKMGDGSVASGTLDENGEARADGVEEGSCEVTFPEYSPNSWERKS